MPFTSMPGDVHATRRSRVWRRSILLTFAVFWALIAAWNLNKSLPPGSHVDSQWYPIAPDQVSFIADITSADAYGRPIVSQAIFDETLKIIRSARHFIVLDYFLFHGEGSAQSGRQLAGELRDALIERRRSQHDLRVVLITDPINEVYGERPSADLLLLRAAGIDVVVTDLNRLRDSNVVYSSLWRLTMGWWSGDGRAHGRPGAEPATSGGWPSPLDDCADPRTFTAWTRLLNFKSNQRRLLIADDGAEGMVGIIGSASPDDAGSNHSNAALKIAGPALMPLLQSELAIARFSGWHAEDPTTSQARAGDPAPSGAAAIGRAKVLTEGAIRAD